MGLALATVTAVWIFAGLFVGDEEGVEGMVGVEALIRRRTVRAGGRSEWDTQGTVVGG